MEVTILPKETLDTISNKVTQEFREEIKKQSDSNNEDDNNQIHLIEKYSRKVFYDRYNDNEL